MAWFGFLALFVGADSGFTLLTTQDAQTPASSNSTPGGSLAPTPMSTSFLGGGNKDVGSGAPTPTSATGKASGASKKKKAPGAAGKAAAAAAAGEDSEDSREKKVRTNFGAARK